MFSLVDKHICIYGMVRKLGRTDHIIEGLKRTGIRALCIIDKKAEENEKYDGVVVINFDTFIECYCKDQKSKYVFILGFQDGNLHSIIARRLAAQGFDNIVFLPVDLDFGYESTLKMRNVYNELLYGDLKTDELIPGFFEMNSTGVGIIKKYSQAVELWIDLEMLHTCEIEGTVADHLGEWSINQYAGFPVLQNVYYKELFDYLFFEEGYPNGYLAISGYGRSEKDLLDNRKQLLKVMNWKLKYDPAYFVDSPIWVKYDESNNRLVLLDGMHRAFFLSYNGFEKVPCIMKKEEYCKFINHVKQEKRGEI